MNNYFSRQHEGRDPMKRMKNRIVGKTKFRIIILVIIGISAVINNFPAFIAMLNLAPTPPKEIMNDFGCLPNAEFETGYVSSVIDGDIIKERIDGDTQTIRYIGIDTPERDEYFYREATDLNSEIVLG